MMFSENMILLDEHNILYVRNLITYINKKKYNFLNLDSC